MLQNSQKVLCRPDALLNRHFINHVQILDQLGKQIVDGGTTLLVVPVPFAYHSMHTELQVDNKKTRGYRRGPLNQRVR